MATKLYLRATAGNPPIAPTPSASWTITTGFLRMPMSTAKALNPMATLSFSDSNAANRSILLNQYVSATALESGQTVTGGQTITAAIRASETNDGNNLFIAIVMRIIASDGTTVRKTMLDVVLDNVELTTSLVNKNYSNASAATNYTTVAGDYLVIEIGVSGDPAVGQSHSCSLRFGDAAASDLPSDDTETQDLNPWVQLNDTLTFDTIRPQAAF